MNLAVFALDRAPSVTRPGRTHAIWARDDATMTLRRETAGKDAQSGLNHDQDQNNRTHQWNALPA